jgi:pimeloyl-ACP methyl ester carboxylesterase
MLVAASAAKPGDPASWYTEWSAAAGRAEALAKAANGHRESAAGAWLRAMEYWRQAFFFLRGDLDDPRLQTGWHHHRAAFRAALPFLPWTSTIAEIPLGAAKMAGYLLRPPGASAARPTVVLFPGYDSTAESAYAETAWMALNRSMNVFTFEGPGQGGMLYDQRVPMRPDFEAALKPAIDWLLAQEGIDPQKVVLIGRSLGGYLAPRGAAHEHRLAALVCDPGQYEFVSRVKKMMLPKFLPESWGDAAWDRVVAADPIADELLEQVLRIPSARDMLAPRMTTMGAKTVGDFLRMQAGYTLDGQAGEIRCPTLVVNCAGDFASQSDMLFAALTCEKKLLELSAESGAGGHCGGLGQQVWAGAVFPWIADTLAWRR